MHIRGVELPLHLEVVQWGVLVFGGLPSGFFGSDRSPLAWLRHSSSPSERFSNSLTRPKTYQTRPSLHSSAQCLRALRRQHLGEFSNTNGDHLPPHASHRSGNDTVGKFGEYAMHDSPT